MWQNQSANSCSLSSDLHTHTHRGTSGTHTQINFKERKKKKSRKKRKHAVLLRDKEKYRLLRNCAHSDQGEGLLMLRKPSRAKFSWRTCLSWGEVKIKPNHHVLVMWAVLKHLEGNYRQHNRRCFTIFLVRETQIGRRIWTQKCWNIGNIFVVDGEKIRNRFDVKLVPENLGQMAAREQLESFFFFFWAVSYRHRRHPYVSSP